ncbi:MAG: glycosyltransferase [Patescibacteria group bacterium]|nr:glycosyltransferase [Patescibacteria group bacterium]
MSINNYNSKKILFITPAYWPAISYGGPIQSVKLLAEEYKKLNNNVVVFSLSYGLEENKFQKRNINGIDVFYFKYFKFFRWFVPIGIIKALFENRNSFDIFHINLIWDPISWISGFILALFNKKIIVSPRGTIEERLIKSRSYKIKKTIYFLFIKFFLKKSLGFHFTSEQEKDEFFNFTKIDKQYIIIPNLFDYQEFQKRVNKDLIKKFNLFDKKYILYFGRINWKKRIELLIEVFYELSKKYKDLYLAILGAADIDYFEKLKQKIKNFDLENKIILSGETIGGDLKIAIYQNAFCFVLPSISENFGYVVVEALASNVPVIISNGVGLKELINKYSAGLIFNGENFNDLKNNLIEKIDLILNNQNFKKELIENGKKLLLNEFDNYVLAKKMLEFYNKILI